MSHPVAVRGGRVHGRVGPAAVAHILSGGAGHQQLMLLLQLLLVGLVAAAPCQLAQSDGVVTAPPMGRENRCCQLCHSGRNEN